MTDSIPAKEYAPEIVHRLRRLQQCLLVEGYAYLAGSLVRWPDPYVAMGRDEAAMVIAPWTPETAEELLAAWNEIHRRHPGAGLLLAGLETPDDLRLRAFVERATGAVGYVQAETGVVALRPAPSLAAQAREMRPEGLEALVALTATETGADIDPITVMETHLQRLAETEAPALPRGPAWFTYIFIALCVGIFGLELVSPLGSDMREWGTLYGPLVAQGEWWRMFSVALLHGGIMHLGFNMMALHYFGSLLEPWQGRWRLAVLFVFSVFTGAIGGLIDHPAVPSVGASGGLFGLMGVFGAMLVRYYRDFPTHMRDGLKKWLGQLLLINLVISFLPGISFGGHMGGMVGGFLLGLILVRSPFRPVAPLPRWTTQALIALVAATLAAAWWAIAQVPLPR